MNWRREYRFEINLRTATYYARLTALVIAFVIVFQWLT